MKIIKFLMGVSFALLMTLGFSACSSDDDSSGTGLSTPAYESVSARYEITSAYSDISSIELTASGNYIIVENINYYESAVKRSLTNFIPRWDAAVKTRATSSNGIIYGKFTKIGENEFELHGFGIVRISTENDNAVALEIEPDGGDTYVLMADKADINSNSESTNKLCRTWSITSLRIKMSYDGKSIFDKEHKMNELDKFTSDFINLIKKFDPEFDESDYSEEDFELFDEEAMPKEVVFSKAGTYMVIYTNESLAIAKWDWTNDEENEFRYSWNYSDMYDDYFAGTVKVGYRNNQLTITESVSEDGENVSVTYYLDEIK